MDPRLTALTEQLLRYRELLAMSYAQKDAIQKGDLSEFSSLLKARQELIERVQRTEQALREDSPVEKDPQTHRRLMSEAAALLEKLVSLDKENERLLEAKSASSNVAQVAKANEGRAAYSRESGTQQGGSRVVNRSK